MSSFGETLFGGSAFIRWTLTPVLIAFAVWIPLAAPELDGTKLLLVSGLVAAALALLAGLWLPERFGRVAFRLLAGLVFAAYAAYFLVEYISWQRGAPVWAGRRSQPSLLSALMGLVAIGLPALLYAWKGRFSLRETATPEMQAATRLEYEKLILKPNWEYCERQLQRPVPAALRALYADEEWVTAGGLEFSEDCSISTFEPLLELSSLDLTDQPESKALVFATSMFGDPIFLLSGPDEADRVYVMYHDGGDFDVLSKSVDEFVLQLKQANQPG
jgi:hypothetical protein